MKSSTKFLLSSILLLNGANLLAQAQNRLEVRGDRLEETENQSTDCRKAELTLEDQIGQRTKTTTNYELRTANCGNLGQDLSCHLMMNPSTIEEGTKAVEKYLGISERRAITAEKTATEEAEAEKKDCWIEKAGVAEAKELAAKPCDDAWEAKQDRADAIITIIRNKVWPAVSQAMKAFIAYPSETTMRNASASTFVYASAYAPAYASAYEYASASDSAYAYASVSAYGYASAYAPAYASVSAHAYYYSAVYASVYAHTSTYASAYTASKIIAESAADAAELEKVFEAAEASSTTALELSIEYPHDLTAAAKENILWSVQSAHEISDFARAVVAFKREQEAAVPAEDRRREMDNRKSGEEEALLEHNRRIEQEKLAEVKTLADSPCDDGWGPKRDRANALMKMAREKFGSPISNSMTEFMLHPNEATLRATNQSFMIAMTPAEAEEAVKTAEFFAAVSAHTAKLGRKNQISASLQKNVDWSETITCDIAEFARAVADFKRKQEGLKTEG